MKTCIYCEFHHNVLSFVSNNNIGEITFFTIIKPPAHVKKQYTAITIAKIKPKRSPKYDLTTPEYIFCCERSEAIIIE